MTEKNTSGQGHLVDEKEDNGRRHDRFKVETQVSYKVINRQLVQEITPDTFNDDGETVNISTSGIALSTDVELSKGDYLKLEMRLPTLERTTRALAEVMWTRTAGQRWESGIRFLIILNEADEHSIHQFIEQVKEGD